MQEALTNAHKHGDGRARLSVRYRPDRVDVEVRNALGVRPEPQRIDDRVPPSSGFGLSGMHERVAAAGGHLEVGPDGAHHFSVRAHFPVVEERR